LGDDQHDDQSQQYDAANHKPQRPGALSVLQHGLIALSGRDVFEMMGGRTGSFAEGDSGSLMRFGFVHHALLPLSAKAAGLYNLL
jgi:hypothetical protein